MLDMHEVGGSSPLVSTIDGAALFCRCAAPAQHLHGAVALPDSRRNKAASATFLFTYFTFYLTCSPCTSYFSLTSSLFTITYNLFSGALAQLGAHNTGSVGVRGSSPLCSTTQKSTSKEVLFCFIADNFDRYTAQIDKKKRKSTKNHRKNLDKIVERI